MKLSTCVMCFMCFVLLFYTFQTQELEESEGGGDFLFLSTNDEVADDSHLRGKRKLGSTKPQCDVSTLSSYLASLQVINPESVIALATKHKLQTKCHTISKTVKHMESYLKTCNLEPEQQQYIQLLRGVKALHRKLCTNDPYAKSFMKYKKCYNQLETEVADSCNGPSDWSENSDSKRVCRAYQEIRDCYFLKASVMCGNKAADVFKELVQCIIESVITVNCTVNVDVEDGPRPSKEQFLMMQKQKLGQTKNEPIEITSSQPQQLSAPSQLFIILFVAFMSKFTGFIFENEISILLY